MVSPAPSYSHPLRDGLVFSRRPSSFRTQCNHHDATGTLACAQRRSDIACCNGTVSTSLHSSSKARDVQKQDAQLSPSDRAMRLVSSNLANCHATVQKLLIRQVLTKLMV